MREKKGQTRDKRRVGRRRDVSGLEWLCWRGVMLFIFLLDGE